MKTIKQSMIALLLLISVKGFGQAPTINGFSPSSGPVGTLVTITGTNLSSPTLFTIGGVSAIVISNTGTTLVGMVMPGAVLGSVSVTTSSGTAAGSWSYSVTATPYPGIQPNNKLVGTNYVGTPGQGYSVALSADGKTAIVGGTADNSSTGAVWVYTRTGSIWTQQGGKLVGSGGVGLIIGQGSSLALSANGNTAIIGADRDNSDAGAAWIFTRSGNVWSQQGGKLVGTGAVNGAQGAWQGWSVALSADGNTAIVGGASDNSNAGAAWVFTRSGNTWTQQGNKLIGTGAIGSYVGLGTSVSLSANGNTAMVGGPLDSSATGAAWVFIRSGGTWTQQGPKLVGTGAIGGAAQGQSVSLAADGNTAIVGGIADDGNKGAAWIFTRNGNIWTQQAPKLVGTGSVGSVVYQGCSVSLSADGNTALVGGEYDDSSRGAIWVYTRTAGIWTQRGSKLVGSGAVGAALQGMSVALSSDASTAIVGGNADNNNIGAAWVFGDSPSAGPDQLHCMNGLAFTPDTVRMAATGVGTWSTLPNNPHNNLVIDSPSAPDTRIYANPFMVGRYGFVWTTIAGPDTVYVTLDSIDLVFGVTVSQPSVCGGLGDSFIVNTIGGGITSLSYQWYLNSTAAGTGQTYVVPALIAGDSISVVVTSSLGCINSRLGNDTLIPNFTVNICPTDTLWPGDADNNKFVDNADLLTIGLGYDSTGPIRAVSGNVWQADLAIDWAHDFTIYAPTVNFNHADCDGNGIINAADTAAILLNFGDIHAKTNGYNGVWRSGIPALKVYLYNDTTYAGDTLTAKFFLGDSATPVSNIYGLAFTYHYDPIVMDSNSFTFGFINSWLGNGSNSINIQKNFASQGVLKVAITGIDHQTRSGSGQIATSRGVITTDNINAKDYSYYLNSAYISDITAIDQHGNPVLLNAGIDSNQVGYYPNGIRETAAVAKVSIYPNPAATQIRISTDVNITGIQITDMLGQQVVTQTVNNRKIETIDISSLAAGVYTLQVTGGNSAGMAKLVVSR